MLAFTVSGGTSGTGTITFRERLGVLLEQKCLRSQRMDYSAAQSIHRKFGRITTSGFSDESSVPTISAEAVGVDGSPQSSNYTLVSGRYAQFDYGGGPMGHSWEAKPRC